MIVALMYVILQSMAKTQGWLSLHRLFSFASVGQLVHRREHKDYLKCNT